MNREPITLRNLLTRARLQDQNVCVTSFSKGCIERNTEMCSYILK